MQQRGRKYFARRPYSPNPRGWGQKVKIKHGTEYFACRPPSPKETGDGVDIQPFQNMVMLHIKLKGVKMQQYGSKYSNLGMGSIGQNLPFSGYGQVAYQIEGNQECSNMVANMLPTTPTPLTLGMESKGQNSTFFRAFKCCIPN